MNDDQNQHYHLVGVGGVGMNALAQVALAQGHGVSGSDRFLDEGEQLDVLDKLKAAGVRLVPQDGSGVMPRTAAVVVSTAIEDDNPDLVAARERNVPVVHRAELLARLAGGKRCIAVSGTSGKTTVTGMVGWMLEQLGADPTVVNGGAVRNWRTSDAIGNVRVGDSDLWVLEADESDRSLLRFEPDWAVITNISRDHFDRDVTASLFAEFAARVKQGVVCGEGVPALLGNTGGRAVPRLIEAEGPCVYRDGTWSFVVDGMRFAVPLPGKHNAENALLSVVLCRALGFDLEAVRDALASFLGIERRLENVGEAGGITVTDDYAHNPAKIAAAWKAAASSATRVLGVWRPHGYGPLAAMLNELAETFSAAMGSEDRLYVLPVFDAGGTADRTVRSDSLVGLLAERGLGAESVSDYDALSAALLSSALSGDTVLIMGARDPDLPRFARRLLGELRKTPLS